jgi:hypothetical protein
VQEIAAEPVALRVDLRAHPPLAVPTAPIRSKDEGYGYKFDDDDPLEAMRPPEEADCPAWSACEVKSVFEVNKHLFQPCLRPDTAGIAFTALARVSQDGVVQEVEISQLSPAENGLHDCVRRAFRQLPFAIETRDLTTVLTVPVRIEIEAPAPR